MKKKRQKKNIHVEEKEKILFGHLSEAFEKTGVEIRFEKGDFRGGMCKIMGERKIMFLNKKYPLEKINNLLISELKSISDYQHYLPPLLRQKVEEN